MRITFTINMLFVFLVSFAVNTALAQDDVALELKILQENDPISGGFGRQVVLDGNRALISDFENAFIYEFDGNAWVQKQRLVIDNPNLFPRESQYFRAPLVDLDGDIAVVTAAETDIDDVRGIDACYVFRFNGIEWVQVQRLGSFFDWPIIRSVAIHGTTIIRGNNNYSFNWGEVWIHEYNGSQWTFTKNLQDPGNIEGFGQHVDIYEDRAVATTGYFATHPTVIFPGDSIYVFERNGGIWAQSDSVLNAYGRISSISLYDNKILAGAGTPATAINYAGPSRANLYQWDESSNNYINTQSLTANDYEFRDYFGSAVSLGENFLFVGASMATKTVGYRRGAGYLFEFNGNGWEQKTRITPSDDLPVFSRFGSAASLDQNRALIGADGAAYFYELMEQPRNVQAADGESNNKVRITWQNKSTEAEGFKIYRDGIEIGSTVLAANAFNDTDAIPGKLYKYYVTSYSTTWGESFPSIADYGWSRANGKITGAVQSEQGAGIDSVTVSISPVDSSLGFSLDFDSADDFILTPFISLPDTFTISAWIKTTSADNQQILGWGSTANADAVEFKTVNGNIAIKLPTTNGDFQIAGNTQINNGIWQHVTTVITGSSFKLYVNGILDRSASSTFPLTTDVNILTIGAYESVRNPGLKTFNGGLDEIQLWQRALTVNDIQNIMDTALMGNEPGLLGYWSFDDSSRSSQDIAADYSETGNRHGNIFGANWSNQGAPVALGRTITDVEGNYAVRNLYSEDLRSFRVTPKKIDHAFDPASGVIQLENGIGQSLRFTDTTVFTLSGQILFAGESCPVEGVELLLDDQPTGIFTDSEGNFQVPIQELNKIHKITPYYGNSLSSHTFSPASRSVFVDRNIDGINFSDVTKHKLAGRVRGGCIAPLGVAQVRISSLENPACFDKTITTDFYGNFRGLFPAQEYLVDIVAINNPDSVNILNYLKPDTVDITWENNAPTPNYVYHPKPIIQVEILPSDISCDPNVPILEQNLQYTVLIGVLEAFQTDTCFVDSGFVTIYDEIGGNPAEPTVLELVNGQAIYTFTAGEPNILSPYLKLMQIVANANRYEVDTLQWALVTGNRPRTATFFSNTTPELPLMVLRDPPGDQSYSFLSKNNTYTFNYNHTIDTTKTPDDDGGLYSFLRLGHIFEFGIAFAGYYSTTFGAYALRVGGEYSDDGKETSEGNSISLSIEEEIRTSDNDKVTGAGADLFIGAAMNQVFFLTDVINYDRINCKVVKDTVIGFTDTGFASTYVYTQDHIRNTLIPQLNGLANLYPAGSDSALIYQNAVNVWEQVLQKNQDAKEAAKTNPQHWQNPDIPNPTHLLEKNISFSGGTSTTQYATMQTDTFNTINYKTIIDGDRLATIGIVVGGAVLEFGTQWRYHYADYKTYDTTRTEISTVGYTLADDDVGDFFSVDILRDPTFDTPIFNLVAGTSSCPWEHGTQPRDGAQLGINSFILNDVPPNEPAIFELSLGNLSESGESRPYDLRLIQLSNPDGAIIKVGGVPMGDALSYFIPVGDSSYMATLSVERGPRAYDYDNIKLVLLPPCEYDLYRGITPLADTVTFSVNFASPLTNSNLSYPPDNWEINPNEPDSLAIVISDYNHSNEYLKSIKLQYRKPNGSWVTALTVPKEQLPEQNLRRSWSYQDLEDGIYELRSVSDGGVNGVRYSPVAKGRIERNAMLLRGTPEPADNILNRGENISVSFASGIDLDKLNAQRDISLIDITDTTLVSFSAAVLGNTLLIQPDSSFDNLGERTLMATVHNLTDSEGKRLRQPLSWTFQVSQQSAYWKDIASEIKVYQGIETIHTAVLYNAGATVMDYKIDYLPEWLTLSAEQSSGSIAAGSEKHLAFKPNSSKAAGLLEDSLSVMLDGKKETRSMVLHVLTAPPNWSLETPATAAFTAQVYTQLLLNEKLSDDAFDIAGVFIDGQLSGRGRVRYDELSGKYVAAFTISNPLAAAGALDFRLWDASEGKEYRFYNAEFSFQSGTSFGSRLNPLIIQPNEVFQSIALDKGVNWVSFNVSSSDLSLQHVLKDWPAGEGDLIKSQFGFSQYSAENGWAGTLDVLSPEAGYRLKTQNSSELLAAGSPANLWVSPALLKEGWNWVGYLPEKALPLSDALQFMQSVPGDMIKSRNKSAIFNNNGEWLGTLKEMQPGQSYALYTQANTELIYPDLQKQSGGNESTITVDAHAFEASMTITAAFSFNELDYGDSSLVVSAFVDGQLRGVATPQYVAHLDRYVTFLMIYGDPEGNGEAIQLQLFNPADNTTRDVSEYLVFEADGHSGNLSEPLQLNALQTESERIPVDFYLKQNYPNPFNPMTTIEYGLPNDAKVGVTIFNALGQQVSVLVNGKQTAGRYKIQFDAAQLGLASGVYFYQINTKGFVKSYKMLLLK